MKNFKYGKTLMKYYVDIIYIMIINGVIISNDKNKLQIEKVLKNIKAPGLSNVKKANGLRSVKGAGLKILK